MSTSRATIRLITLLFLLAGLLLLRKPIFGQAITAAPQMAYPENLSISGHPIPIMDKRNWQIAQHH